MPDIIGHHDTTVLLLRRPAPLEKVKNYFVLLCNPTFTPEATKRASHIDINKKVGVFQLTPAAFWRHGKKRFFLEQNHFAAAPKLLGRFFNAFGANVA